MIVFEKSPLIRVRFSVDFELSAFSSVTFGRYWDAIKTRFPIAEQEQAPSYTAADEKADGSRYLILPPLRRVIYESANRSRRIELEDGRFSYTWSRATAELQYPRYETLFAQFEAEWQAFTEWCISEDGVPVSALSQRLFYRNEITADHGWDGPGTTHDLVAICPRPWQYERVNGEHYFADYVEDRLGTLSISIEDSHYRRSADRTAPRSLFLDLTIRSVSGADVTLGWFAEARAQINAAFAGVITEKASVVFGATNE